MENCGDCGTKMVMHYSEFCPKCYIPKPKIIAEYDLLKCMYHVQALGYENFYKNLCEEIIDEIPNNHCSILLNTKMGGLVEVLFNVCNIKDEEVFFQVSW